MIAMVTTKVGEEIRTNPFITVLLALLVAALGFIGASMNRSFDQIWTKLDRVTALMQQEKESIRADMRDIQKIAMCHDKELAEIRERIANHITEWERKERLGSNGMGRR